MKIFKNRQRYRNYRIRNCENMNAFIKNEFLYFPTLQKTQE